MSAEQKLTRVLRTFTHRLMLSPDELAAGRALERIASEKEHEAAFAKADVENYYDAFFERDAETEMMARAEKFAGDFWSRRGLRVTERPVTDPPKSPTDATQ